MKREEAKALDKVKSTKDQEFKETPREFDFNGELIKHVVILNPSKEKAALERYFDSFSRIMGKDKEAWEIK